MFDGEIYTLLKAKTAEIQATVAEIAKLDAAIKERRYSDKTLAEEIYPQRAELRRKLDAQLAQTGKEVRALIAEYQERLRAEDDLDPSAITDDVKLFTAGVKLTARDISAIVERNANNRTMTQLALRYADEHGLNDDKLRYVGNADELKRADEVGGVAELYLRNWIQTDRALDMLDRFFPERAE